MVRMCQRWYEVDRTGKSMATKRPAPPLRRPEPQRATFLELFFDLAFVFALSQLSNSLMQRLHWTGALQALALLLVLWRVWNGVTWITDRFDQRWLLLQLLVILTLLGTLVLGAALPEAFGKHGLIFAGVYVAVEVGRYVVLAFALHGYELTRIAARPGVWSVASAPAWIAGGLTHGTARGALWAFAISVDYIALVLNFPIPRGLLPAWEPPVAVEHLAERYRQVFIVALGELILVSGIALHDSDFAPGATTAFVVSVATTALLWRIYLFRAGGLLSEAFAADPASARLHRLAVYVHLVMIAGIVVTGVGYELAITDPFKRTPLAWAVVILGGPALFLAGRVGFEYEVFARVSWDRLIGLLVLGALTPLALLVPTLLAAIAAAVVLAAVAVADVAGARRRPTELPSPPAPARDGGHGG